MLRSYYQHVSRYENSLVTKFYGVHCVKPIGGQKVWIGRTSNRSFLGFPNACHYLDFLLLLTNQIRFIVMGNLFCSEYQIHRRFDLKGSSHGRTTDKPEEEIDETTTLKDLDLNFVFRVQRNWFQELIK